MAAVAVGLLLTSCSGGSDPNSGPLEQTTITVDAFQATDSAGLFIAEQDGLFAKEGLNVKLVPEPLVQPQIDNLVNGKADIITGDYITFIENQTGGDPDLGNKNPHLEIIDEESFLQPNVLALVVPPGSKTASIADLKGKRISVIAPRNIGDILVNSLLEANDIPLNDEKFPLVLFQNVGTGFTKNAMDAAFVPEPFITLLGQGGGVQELADLDEGATANFPIQGLATSQSWAANNPNTLKAFLTAYNEGQVIASTQRSQVERALETYLQLPKVVAAVVALPAFPQGVDPIRLQRAVNAMVQNNFISKKFDNFNIRNMIYSG